MRNIVLNIPHSSALNYDADEWDDMDLLRRQVDEWTDWFTDSLFIPDETYGGRIKANVFKYSRFYVDAERLVDDEMNKIGQGIIYTCFNGNNRKVVNQDRLMDIYHEYLNSYKPLLDSDSILIDCHSFPSSVNKEVQICIGYNEDESRPSDEQLCLICSSFTDAGYRVGVNEPYSNSLTPVNPINYRSVMIEVNKSVYMDDTKLNLVPGYFKLRDVIIKMYSDILNC